MPAVLSYPGVYIDEVPSGVRTITGVPTAICAFLGRTISGLVNTPTILNSFGDFERGFGGLSVNYPVSYAIRDFFLNGGGQAIIVRLYTSPNLGSPPTSPPTASDGTAKISFNNTTAAGNAALTLGLQAASPGSWGTSIRVAMALGPTDPTTIAALGFPPNTQLFDLIVKYPDSATTVERIRNLTFADTARRVDRVLPNESNFIRINPVFGDIANNGSVPNPVTNPTVLLTNYNTTTDIGVGDPNGQQGADSQLFGASDSTAFLGNQTLKTGLFALEKTDLFNLLCIPPDIRGGNVSATTIAGAVSYCRTRRAMMIVDPPTTWTTVGSVNISDLTIAGLDGRNAAVYFPRILQADPLRGGQIDTFVACGTIAGVMASTDATRGVFKAPAGIDAGMVGVRGLSTIAGLPFSITDAENGQLNPLGVNCLRIFPIVGPVVWGARTVRGADQLADDYKYVPVRRLVLFLEESLYRGTKFAVFEPNDEPLWSQIRLNVGAFMQNLFRQGAFQGQSPKDAYFVKCDKESTTQNDINLGVVNIIVGFAPLKPAEFIVIKIQQITGQIST